MRAFSRGAVRRRPALRAAVFLLVGVVGGCHEYRAVPPAALVPPAAVRVRYDTLREVAVRSGAEAGVRPLVSELTGRIVARAGDSLEVQVGGAARAGEKPSALAPGVVVAVPLDTTAVWARRFSPGRTAKAVLGGLGATVVALFVACGEFCR